MCVTSVDNLIWKKVWMYCCEVDDDNNCHAMNAVECIDEAPGANKCRLPNKGIYKNI